MRDALVDTLSYTQDLKWIHSRKLKQIRSLNKSSLQFYHHPLRRLGVQIKLTKSQREALNSAKNQKKRVQGMI